MLGRCQKRFPDTRSLFLFGVWSSGGFGGWSSIFGILALGPLGPKVPEPIGVKSFWTVKLKQLLYQEPTAALQFAWSSKATFKTWHPDWGGPFLKAPVVVWGLGINFNSEEFLDLSSS